MIYSRSEVGSMVDFLKAYPFVSMEEYKWGLSVPLIRLMCADNTHVHYLSDKERERRKGVQVGSSNGVLLNDLGIPVL